MLLYIKFLNFVVILQIFLQFSKLIHVLSLTVAYFENKSIILKTILTHQQTIHSV